MEVLLEPVEKGWRAMPLSRRDIVAEGATEAEALWNLRLLSQQKLPEGANVVEVPMWGAASDELENPWLVLAGSLQDDPTFDDWQEEIAKYRAQIDREEET